MMMNTLASMASSCHVESVSPPSFSTCVTSASIHSNLSVYTSLCICHVPSFGPLIRCSVIIAASRHFCFFQHIRTSHLANPPCALPVPSPLSQMAMIMILRLLFFAVMSPSHTEIIALLSKETCRVDGVVLEFELGRIDVSSSIGFRKGSACCWKLRNVST